MAFSIPPSLRIRRGSLPNLQPRTVPHTAHLLHWHRDGRVAVVGGPRVGPQPDGRVPFVRGGATAAGVDPRGGGVREQQGGKERGRQGEGEHPQEAAAGEGGEEEAAAVLR